MSAGPGPLEAMTLRGSGEPLTARYDTALLDLDGVVYVGPAAVPGVPELLAGARRRGMRLAYVTNNAARPPDTVAKHLTELGVPATAEDVVTSAQAAARLVAGLVPRGAAVLVVGGEGLVAALAEHGLTAVDSAEAGPAAVAQGFAPTVDWTLLAEGAIAVNRGLPWVASNLDLTIPTPRGRAPGNGTLVAAIRAATEREPLVAGKPELPLHREATLRTGAQRPLVVGDRLDTDIEGAVRAGTDSLLVLSGVTDVPHLLTAPRQRRPTYLAPDAGGLLVPHPDVAETAEGRRCGRWAARIADGRLELAAADEPEVSADGLDGLRAACAAVWSADGADVDLTVALRRLG
jgi:glycerol-1-phosphatase